MTRYLLAILFLYSFKQVHLQIIRSPLSLLNRPLNDAILDPRQFIEAPRQYIEAPRPYIEAPRPYIEAPRPYIEAPRPYIEAPRPYIEAPRPYIEAARPYVEAPRPYIEAPRPYIEAPRPYIDSPIQYIETPRQYEAPRNYVEVPRVIEAPKYIENPIPYPSAPSTTIISDCTPSVCKNLANTINLMILCGMLQNKANDEVAVKFAAPLLREIIANPTGAIASTTTVSSLLNANALIPNFVSANIFSPNVIGSNSPCNNANNAAVISNLLKILGASV